MNRILRSTETRIHMSVDRPVSRNSETFITNTTNERRLIQSEMFHDTDRKKLHTLVELKNDRSTNISNNIFYRTP
jgi:hypothetical protein